MYRARVSQERSVNFTTSPSRCVTKIKTRGESSNKGRKQQMQQQGAGVTHSCGAIESRPLSPPTSRTGASIARLRRAACAAARGFHAWSRDLEGVCSSAHRVALSLHMLMRLTNGARQLERKRRGRGRRERRRLPVLRQVHEQQMMTASTAKRALGCSRRGRIRGVRFQLIACT